MPEILPCCYCGSAPTLERPEPTGTWWDKAGRLVCRAPGCPGNGLRGASKNFSTGYERLWNQRQRQYGSVIDRARRTQPALVAFASQEAVSRLDPPFP